MKVVGTFSVGKNVLVPFDQRGRDLMAALAPGDRVLVKVHRARNPEHNALAHAVFAEIGNAMSKPMEVVKLWLKWETGYVDLIRLPNGRVMPSPRSLAFESMSQDEFQRWWDEAWVVLAEKAMPRISQDVFDRIVSMVGSKSPPLSPADPARADEEVT